MVRRAGYLEEFLDFWSARPEIKRVWFSMYTPQIGELSNEMLSPQQRTEAVRVLRTLHRRQSKLDMRPEATESFLSPPKSPAECTFARTTHTISADMKTHVTPCQFGGNPDCSHCGCVASVALHALTEMRTPIGVKIGTLLNASLPIGEWNRPSPQAPPPPGNRAAAA